jgi:hypothetical protein
MATVLPCGHTKAQHIYADAGELVLKPCDGRVVQRISTMPSEGIDPGSNPGLSTISAVKGSALDYDCPMALCGKMRGVPCAVLGGVPSYHLERSKLARVPYEEIFARVSATDATGATNA